MNCFEFRHQLLTEPRCNDSDFHQHRDTCSACAREATCAFQFEDTLLASFSVTPPDGLKARIILAQTLLNDEENRDKKNRGRFQPQWLAAAMVLLVIGLTGWLGVQWTNQPDRFSSLQTAVLNHITDELYHLHEDNNVQTADISRTLTPFGMWLDGDFGRVNYLGRCNIRKHSGVHLVVPGDKGSVTILLMPGEFISAVMDVSSTRFTGRILPTSYGSIAVVGEHGEMLDNIADDFIKNIRWASQTG